MSTHVHFVQLKALKQIQPASARPAFDTSRVHTCDMTSDVSTELVVCSALRDNDRVNKAYVAQMDEILGRPLGWFTFSLIGFKRIIFRNAGILVRGL